ncbi:hypothetical protein MRS44_017608 [Fusarium solani]|uniref:uncharacterized protein n=1 Tax=Fusarium solani TaxID=169388 RepID=UPI0032C46D27|nr:hypothetical protein MRS44_017608 [Fusarium solani]
MFASIPTPDSLRQVFSRQAYNEAVIGLLTQRRALFSTVEWNELKDLALACNPTIGDQLITSRRQAMRHIAENHVFYRDQIKDKLAIASSPIHISTDLWTSPHRHALLAVCAQWVDQDYELQKALLGLPECRGNHSGERQANLIMNILETFGIMSKLGYHTGDNATSNDTCLESIARRLKENLNVDYDPKKRRIRCIGHIINLSLQAFLLGSSNEAFNAALDAASEATSEDLLIRFPQALATRRRRGRRRLSRSDVDEDYLGIEGIPALRKLHGLAVWTRCSSLNSQLWDDERHYSAPETRDERMLHVIDMGWFIMDKYYTMTEDVPVYSAALLLDPSKRDAYIKQNWADEWHDNAIGGAQAIWEEEYNIGLPTKPPAAPSAVADIVEHESNKLAQFARITKVKTAVLRSEDDFMTFITAQPIEIDSTPLQWWCASEQWRIYPRLSRMAIAILSIPPESSEPERAFSGACSTCSWDRLRIKCANIERIECIGSWLREGHLIPTSRGGFGLPMMVSELKDDLTDSDDNLEDREDID